MSITENTVSPRIIPEPVCSSDSIWYKEDMNTSITTILDNKAALVHEHTGYAAESHTHTDYAPAVHEHLDYATSTHTHDTYAPMSLMPIKENGDVKENLTGEDVLSEIAAKTAGLYTFYAATGSTNNPTNTSSWRFFTHKTAVAYGWVLAFGPDGVYENYLNNGVWGGWKSLCNPSVGDLWRHPTSSGWYMNASQTVVPSKKLSECVNGWILCWSDFDPDTLTANNFDQCFSYISKKNVMGNNWNGEGYMCVLPVYSSDDGTADDITIKNLRIWDDRITGKDKNAAAASNRRDVVLRAVYEF